MRTGPRLAAIVNNVDDVELAGVLGLEGVELFLEEDVLLADVREDQLELGLVLLVGKCVVENLIQRGTNSR